MRKKTMLAWVLAFLMFFTSGFSQLAYAANKETLATGLTEGSYTDTTADAASKYEYTITGSDGSASTVTVAAQDTEEDGNVIEKISAEPEITWTRTKDDKTNTVTDLTYVNSDKEVTENSVTYAPYTALTWQWSSLDKLINDKETKQDKVWDYEDTNGATEGISAAYLKTGGSTWDKAAVHKISGTFAWPEGYDLNKTTITLESVNDAKYTAIYDYIEKNNLSDLFPQGKVFPVNDDVYVVMWVEDESTKVTSENINDYLLFWTGTSGKGIWTQNGNTQADWSRTTPATFLSASKQGVRAFYQAYPNAVGVTSGLNNGNVTNLATPSYLKQTDYWYTLTDTTAINSVMRKNYPNGIKAETKVHLDLYCFNNSEQGGIDELKIKLETERETETSVQVQYYYGDVTNTSDTDHYLGSSVLTNQEYGSSISLTAGTKASQLDYMRAAAIVKAGNKDVSSGVQTIDPFIVTRGTENIIYVVYTAKDAKVVFLTAASDTLEYDGNSHTLNTVSVTENGYTGEATAQGNGVYVLPDGNTLSNVYSVVTATDPGKYPNNFTTGDGSKPERKVKDSYGNEVTKTYTFITTPGILTITYEPKSVEYTYDFGVNNLYEGTLEDVELKATVTESSEEVTVDGADVTYTPSAADTGDSVDLTLTFTGDYKVTKTINFIPATNVMYEENLIKLTETDQTSNIWKTEENAEGLPTVGDNENTVYGFTEVEQYATSDSFSNESYHTAKLTLESDATTVKTSNAAEFTFTGTGFDLISECGTDTGMLVVRVDNTTTGKIVKSYVVDTYFTGDQADDEDEPFITGEGILDYQVPVVRNMELPYGTYKVTVYGYLNRSAGAATVSTDSMRSSVNPTDEIVMVALEECDFDDIDLDDVEVSFMDENSVLNGGTGVAENGEPVAVSYSAENADEADATVTANVYLDGFRVYKPLESDANIYKTDKEDNTMYASVYDFIKDSVTDLEDTWVEDAFVYVEYDGNTDVAAISEYKVQGPQNEVYLTPGSGIAFALEGYEDGDVVQVAMKAVGVSSEDESGLSVTETESSSAIMTAAEMYYEVIPEKDEELDAYIVNIINSEDSTNILSLSGLKISAHIQPMANAATGNKLIEKLEKSAEAAFEPEYFVVTAKGDTVKSGRNIALTVQSSTDDVANVRVEVLDPSGNVIKDLGKETLTPTNKKAVSNGKAQYYKYSYTFKTKDLEKGTYRINVYAQDAQSKNSNPVTVEMTVN